MNIDKVLKDAIEYSLMCNGFFKDYVIPKRERGKIVGYYVLDETKTTTIKTFDYAPLYRKQRRSKERRFKISRTWKDVFKGIQKSKDRCSYDNTCEKRKDNF